MLHRQIRMGELTRYRAESEWKLDSGIAEPRHYRYDLNFLVLKGVRLKRGQRDVPTETSDEDEPGVAATYRVENMDAWAGETRLPRVRLAGVYGVRLTDSGMPLKLVMDGEAGLFGLPLLSWYLPPTLSRDGFGIPGQWIANGVVAEGRGQVISLGKHAVFHSRIWIGPGELEMEKRPTVFDARTEWDLRTGRLISADGTVTQPGGTLTFTIRS
jgi:hypothetical protein